MSITKVNLTQLAQSLQTKNVLTVSLNAQFLQHNFAIVKECLIRIQQLQGSFGQQQQATRQFMKRLEREESNHLENKENIKRNHQKILELQNNVGDQFMKRMYGIEQKTKNMFGFDQTVSRLQKLGKFVTIETYQQNQDKLRKQIDQVKKIKDQLDRYVPNSTFETFKEQNRFEHEELKNKIDQTNKDIKKLGDNLNCIKESLAKSQKNIEQNRSMIDEINFPQMLEKIRKFREDMDQKMNDLILKMKKKVGNQQLTAFEQTMIDKLDKFLTQNEKTKAQKNQTKNVLIFLQKRIHDIEQIFTQKTAQDDKDALFSTKKIQCASCTKDLGKFEGKLGQYKPWSVFPCKQMDPEKTGGLGYMSYVDKINIKRGSSLLEDTAPNTERLNKTFYDREKQKEREGSPKANRGNGSAVKGSNLVSNYGTQQKAGMSLKNAYFRQLKTQKGERANSKFFRVKNKANPQLQKVKEV